MILPVTSKTKATSKLMRFSRHYPRVKCVTGMLPGLAEPFTGSTSDYYNKPLEVPDDALAVYPVRRDREEGPIIKFMCIRKIK